MAISVFGRNRYADPEARLISDKLFYVIMSATLLFGFAVNAAEVFFLADWIAGWNPVMFFIVYLVMAVAGILINAFSRNPAVSFIGYCLVVLPIGAMLALVVPSYAFGVVRSAFAVTTLLAVVFGLLAVLYPTLSGAELAVAARLLQWQAAGIVPVVVMQLLCSSLQAMDGGGKVMRIMLVAAIVKQALQAVLIPRVGVVGAPVAQCAMYFVAATAAAFVYRKRTGSAFIARKTFAKTALAGVIMVIAEKAVTLADISPWAKLAAAAVTAIAAYIGVLLAVCALKPRFRRENNTNEETRRHCRDARHIDD